VSGELALALLLARLLRGLLGGLLSCHENGSLRVGVLLPVRCSLRDAVAVRAIDCGLMMRNAIQRRCRTAFTAPPRCIQPTGAMFRQDEVGNLRGIC